MKQERERERLPGELRAAGLIVAPSALPPGWRAYMATAAEPEASSGREEKDGLDE